MSPRGITTAFILDTTAYRDHDLMVRLFTREAGTVSALAYHARKTGKRFPSGVDRITLAEVTIARKGTGPYVLQGVDPKELYWNLKSDLERSCVATLWTEMLMRSHGEADELPALFDMTRWFLSGLDGNGYGNPQSAALQAAIAIPAALEFLDTRFQCSRCNASGTEHDWTLMSDTGQLLCANHKDSLRYGIRLGARQAQLLLSALEGIGARDSLDLDPESATTLLFRLEPFLSGLFNGRLKSLDFLADLWGAQREMDPGQPST